MIIGYIQSWNKIFSMNVSSHSITTIITISNSSVIAYNNIKLCNTFKRSIKIKSCKVFICFFCFYFCFLFIPINTSFKSFIELFCHIYIILTCYFDSWYVEFCACYLECYLFSNIRHYKIHSPVNFTIN